MHKTSIYSLICLYKKNICVPPPGGPWHSTLVTITSSLREVSIVLTFLGGISSVFLMIFLPMHASLENCLFCHFEEYMVDILHLFFCTASFLSIIFVRFTQIIEYMCNQFIFTSVHIIAGYVIIYLPVLLLNDVKVSILM